MGTKPRYCQTVKNEISPLLGVGKIRLGKNEVVASSCLMVEKGNDYWADINKVHLNILTFPG